MDSVPGDSEWQVCHSGKDELLSSTHGVSSSSLVAGGTWSSQSKKRRWLQSQGIPDTRRSDRLRKIPDCRPWVSAESEAQRG